MSAPVRTLADVFAGYWPTERATTVSRAAFTVTNPGALGQFAFISIGAQRDSEGDLLVESIWLRSSSVLAVVWRVMWDQPISVANPWPVVDLGGGIASSPLSLIDSEQGLDPDLLLFPIGFMASTSVPIPLGMWIPSGRRVLFAPNVTGADAQVHAILSRHVG